MMPLLREVDGAVAPALRGLRYDWNVRSLGVVWPGVVTVH